MKNLMDKTPYGGLLERDNEHYMVRARVFCGELSLDQLKTIVEVGQGKHASLRLTYRQNIQLYHFSKEELEEAVHRLEAEDLPCSGRQGDIVISSLSGYSISEAFDVKPYAVELWRWLSAANVTLPGKFKMVFSSSEDDEGNGSFADLAFYAKIHEGKRVFDVYGGGSLGAMPLLGVRLEENLSAEDFLLSAKALVDVYIALFKDVNVFKKRLRFKVREIGAERFKALYQEAKQKLSKSHQRFIVEFVEEEEKNWGNIYKGDSSDVLETAYKGIYAVRVRNVDGNILFSAISSIGNFLQNISYPYTIRIGSRHELYILGLNGDDARFLVELLPKIMGDCYPKEGERALQTCVGAQTCKFGFTHTMALMDSLRGLKDLPQIAISGCMNSCPQHQIADIGFFGRKPNPEDIWQEVYEVHVGGSLKTSKEEGHLGEVKGKILAKDVKGFLEKMVADKPEGISWRDYLCVSDNIPQEFFIKE